MFLECIMTISTERLTLLSPDKNFAEELLPYRNSEFVLKYNCMRERSLEDFRKDIEKEEGDENIFYLKENSSGRIMGVIYLTEDSLRYNVGSLMLEYWLGEDFARKGYMSEAIKAVLRHAFTELNCELITVRVFEENVASNALVRKLGFIHEGTLRRCVRTPVGRIFADCQYSMTREEFKS